MKSASKIATKSPRGRLQPLGQRAGLVPGPVGPVQVRDRVAQSGHLLARLAGDLGRVVGAVVQHLDLQLLARVVDLTGGLDDPLGDEVLVVHRQLHGHPRQLVEATGRQVRVVLVLVVQVNQHVPVEPVPGDDGQDDQVRDGNGGLSVRLPHRLSVSVRASGRIVADSGDRGCGRRSCRQLHAIGSARDDKGGVKNRQTVQGRTNIPRAGPAVVSTTGSEQRQGRPELPVGLVVSRASGRTSLGRRRRLGGRRRLGRRGRLAFGGLEHAAGELVPPLIPLAPQPGRSPGRAGRG